MYLLLEEPRMQKSYNIEGVIFKPFLKHIACRDDHVSCRFLADPSSNLPLKAAWHAFVGLAGAGLPLILH
jgi:hypothetical protein